jgi:ABC-type lipoprotein export system ATPase subunit
MANNAITYLKINHLQRLRNIELEIPEVGVTALVGVNGSGKSTIIRALACIFQPKQDIKITQEDYRPQRFFLPYEGCDWNDSKFEVKIKSDQIETREFKKEGDSWIPLPISRFHRYVKLIGIGDAVPHIERDKDSEALAYEKLDFWQQDKGEKRLRAYLSEIGKIMDRTYPSAGQAKKKTGSVLDFLYASVTDRSLGNLSYPSHYMGAGEQKIFEVVREVFLAPKGSLILIEEPEVSLHNKAMSDLLLFLQEQAEKKDLQIVISTHWLGIKDWKDKLKIYSLHVDPTSDAITCNTGLTPSGQHALSGLRSDIKKVTVWVEDELARKIVDRVANDLNVRQFLRKIGVAYSANNLFSVAAGLVIDRDVVNDVLIVGDGDVATSPEEKQSQLERRINTVRGNMQIDGPNAWVDLKRNQAASLITEFSSPNNENPESFFLSIAAELEAEGTAQRWLAEDLSEIRKMRNNPSPKEALYKLAKMKCDSEAHADITNELGRLQDRLIGAISGSERWAPYVQPVATRLKQMCVDLGLIEQKTALEVSAEIAIAVEATADIEAS